MSSRVARAAARLASAGQKVAVAETSSGGLIAAELLAQSHPLISVVIQERWNDDEFNWDNV